MTQKKTKSKEHACLTLNGSITYDIYNGDTLISSDEIDAKVVLELLLFVLKRHMEGLDV